jgi:hypothetical protein
LEYQIFPAVTPYVNLLSAVESASGVALLVEECASREDENSFLGRILALCANGSNFGFTA